MKLIESIWVIVHKNINKKEERINIWYYDCCSLCCGRWIDLQYVYWRLWSNKLQGGVPESFRQHSRCPWGMHRRWQLLMYLSMLMIHRLSSPKLEFNKLKEEDEEETRSFSKTKTKTLSVFFFKRRTQLIFISVGRMNDIF